MIPEGTDALSPAPHHDIYSIEDLSQLIYALKEATDYKKPVSVKIAAVHNIAAIASGIVRAGADYRRHRRLPRRHRRRPAGHPRQRGHPHRAGPGRGRRPPAPGGHPQPGVARSAAAASAAAPTWSRPSRWAPTRSISARPRWWRWAATSARSATPAVLLGHRHPEPAPDHAARPRGSARSA